MLGVLKKKIQLGQNLKLWLLLGPYVYLNVFIEIFQKFWFVDERLKIKIKVHFIS